MKTKRGKFVKSLGAICVILLALSFGLAFVFYTNKDKTLNAVFSATDEFTGVDENGLVFNMEKVAIIANEQDNNYNFTTELYSNREGVSNNENNIEIDEEERKKHLLNDYTLSNNSTLIESGNGSYRDYLEYYYRPIRNAGKPKYVVNNNEFVMLNNIQKQDGSGNTYYANNSIEPTFNKIGEQVEMQEAIMLSFGQWFYSTNENGTRLLNHVKNEENATGAGINFVSNVRITRNGSAVDVPMRAYSSLYADFAMIIEQKPENEGYWTIELSNYLYNGINYSGSFSFYLIFNTSYTGTVEELGQVYNVSPNLLCNGNPIATNESGIRTYKLDENTSFPVITYDYTKYQLSYEVTANGSTTNYVYENLPNNRAQLRCTFSGAKNGTTTYFLKNYSSSNNNNLVSVLLTDVGEYSIHYNYIYTGPNYVNAPKMNLTMNDEFLTISGVELMYYNNLTRAQMKYVTISNNSQLKHLDVILPSGYEKEQPAVDSKIMYSFNLESTLRAGNTETYEGGDYNVKLNNYIVSNPSWTNAEEDTTTASITNIANAIKDLAKQNSQNTTKEGEQVNNKQAYITNLLKHLNITKAYTLTNQGSIEFLTNNSINWENCFYVYSKDALTNSLSLLDKATEQKSATVFNYTRQTTFDKVGYYIVFLSIKDGNQDRYIMFTFQYNSNTGNIELFDSEDNSLHSGAYTNKDVKIVWEERGVFERKVSVVYYTSNNREVFNGNANLISNLTPKDGKFEYYLSLPSGYLHYKIGINVEGLSTVYSYVTIDKQPISGITVYEVENYINNLGNIDYRYSIDENGHNKELADAITNGIAGITWNDKLSGANINVKYSLTEFVTASLESMELDGNHWHLSPYKLADSSSVADDEIISNKEVNPLFKQGIYMFTFTDDAGNTCDYAFVVDKTENYLKIIDSKNADNVVFASSNWHTYYDDVLVELGTHKAINLQVADTVDNKVKDLINSAVKSEVNTLNNYFVGIGSNYAAINKLFASYNNLPYLLVENTKLEVRDDFNNIDSSLSQDITESNYYVRMNYNGGGTSMIRKFYLAGANNRLSMQNAGSNVTIEINPDNSRGMLYYSNVQSSLQQIETNPTNLNRLVTGNSLASAHATSDNFLGFTWLEGVGATEIESVTLNYYRLVDTFNSNQTSASFGSYYAENPSIEPITLYNKNEAINSNITHKFVNLQGYTAYWSLINPQIGATAEGLYVITRTYEGGVDSDFGEDTKVLNYYFIVDRNGIIEVTNQIVGGGIYLDLMNGEKTFNSFNSFNLIQEKLTYEDPNNKVDILYSNYLNNATATKLPAQFYVPVSKYFNGTNLGSYYAGRLTIGLYFVDTQKQLSSFTNQKTHKLFEVVTGEDDFVNINGKTYYSIDITKNLINDSRLQNALLATNGESSWLTLPGDYVLVINDTVEGSTKHQKTIGLRINGKASLVPFTPVYATNDIESGYNDVYVEDQAGLTNNEYYLTTNKEFVKVDINKYDQNSTLAQADPDFIKITQIRDNKQVEYLSIENGLVNGIGKDNAIIENSSLSVKLDTYLRGLDNNILADYQQEMQYLITIRYKLVNPNAYYYIENGQRYTYYQTTYKVVIDRVPPTENINNLIQTDAFNQFNLNDVFETTYQDGGLNGVSYVTHYKNYYTNNLNKNENIYPLKVNSETSFDNADVKNIYVHKINDIATEQLSHAFSGGYVAYTNFDAESVQSYGQLISDAGYYEIVEVDACGNVSQYVVLFGGEETVDNLVLKLSYFGVNENGATNVSGEPFEIEFGEVRKNTITVRSFEKLTVSLPDNLFDVIYRVQLTNLLTGNVESVITTNPTTKFIQSLGNDIVNMFTTAGYGNYALTIYTRSANYTYNINYHESRRLSVEKMVESNGNSYILNLAGANELDNSAYYYATKITLYQYQTKDEDGNLNNPNLPEISVLTYVVQETNNVNNPYVYYLEGQTSGDPVENNLVVLNNSYYVNYKLVMTDSNGNSYNYLFSTDPSSFYYQIKFGANNMGNAFTYNNTYYAFDLATVEYNTFYFITAIVKYTINGNREKEVDASVSSDIINNTLGEDKEFISITNGKIVINPYFKNSMGGIIDATIKIIDTDGNEAFTYHIVLDTNFGSAASLVDDRGNPTGMNFGSNIANIFEDIKSTITATGTRYLSWTNYLNNSQFTFNYKLYEQVEENNYLLTDLNDKTSVRIDPSLNSTGVFRFVIEAVAPNGEVMGNVVYAFNVQAESNDLYTAHVGNLKVSANSVITINEILSGLGKNINDITNALNKNNVKQITPEDVPTLAPVPLYVYNNTISIERADDADYFANYSTTFAGNRFVLYRIGRGNDIRWVATLQVENSANIVESLKVNGINYNRNGQVLAPNSAFGNAQTKNYNLTFVRNYGSTNSANANGVLKKNVLLLDVYYYGSFVKTLEFATNSNNISEYVYNFSQSGQYGLVFRDLAGNEAEIYFSYNGESDKELSVTVLNEVVLAVNGQAPIPNGYYNGGVVVSLLNPSLYSATAPIEVYYTRNGEQRRKAESGSYSYNFTASGWYKVEVFAEINGVAINKTIQFTIINPKEAYTMFSINNKYINITKVLNNYDADITNQFVDLVLSNNGALTYDMVMQHAADLGVSFGKQTFKVTYTCETGDYPVRTNTFVFTLNNEVPNIESSLKPGEHSNKGFSISFNAGEIYRQVGDCSLIIYRDRIGGRIDYELKINENTRPGLITTLNYKRNGAEDDGDYYIVLVSDSGNYINSFKVSITEPLNKWAILVIVVVVVVVSAVTISIILLRKKMRIR